jgi:transcriptional regulator with XRE-family HTH domain
LRADASLSQRALAAQLGISQRMIAYYESETDRRRDARLGALGSGAVASFTTMEEALDFRVEVDRAGRATVTGKLRELGELGADLSFAFESDRSLLIAAHST